MREADRTALRARLAARLPTHWRTRFAPAPTGPLHLGHAVSAVFVWSIARAFGGSVLLRIEDHDGHRARDAFDAGIIADLAWLGLQPDNATLGQPTPLRQRATDAPYAHALAALADQGLAYACRCSRRGISSCWPTAPICARSSSARSGNSPSWRLACRSIDEPAPGSSPTDEQLRRVVPVLRPIMEPPRIEVRAVGHCLFR